MKNVIVLVGLGLGLSLGCHKQQKVPSNGPSATAIPTLDNGRYAPGLRMTVRTLATFPAGPGQMLVSPDGTRVAAGGLFSPDSKHLVGFAPDNRSFVLDGVPTAQYKLLGTPTFTPDNRLAFGAMRTDGQAVLVVDGKETTCDPREYVPMEIRFSPDRQHLAYVGTANINGGNQNMIFVDGKAWPGEYDWVSRGSLQISPDGKRVAVVVREGVVENGVAHKAYDMIPLIKIVFSPDSTRLLYSAAKGDKQYLVENGKEIKTYNRVQPGTITVSPDGKRLAYAAYTGDELTGARDFDSLTGTGTNRPLKGHCVVIVDGKETEGSGIGFDFSSDSQHLAYVEGEAGIIRGACPEHPQYSGSGVILDGQRLGRSIDVVQHLQFSPDNKHVAYLTCGSAEEKPTIVVDGLELPFTDDGCITHLWFTSPDTLTGIVEYAEMGKDIRRVEFKLQAGAAPPSISARAPLPAIQFVPSQAAKPVPSRQAINSQLAAARAVANAAASEHGTLEQLQADAPDNGAPVQLIKCVEAGLAGDVKGAIKDPRSWLTPAQICMAAGDTDTALKIADLGPPQFGIHDPQASRQLNYKALAQAARDLHDETCEYKIMRRMIELERQPDPDNKTPPADRYIIFGVVQSEITDGQFAVARAIASMDPASAGDLNKRINAADKNGRAANSTKNPGHANGADELNWVRYQYPELYAKLTDLFDAGKFADASDALTKRAMLVDKENNFSSVTNPTILQHIAALQVQIGHAQAACDWTAALDWPRTRIFVRIGIANSLLARMADRDPSVIAPLNMK